MRPLNIVIIGYNSRLSIKGFNCLVESNIEEIRNVSSVERVARFKDGTTLEALVSVNEVSLKGRRIDQLILFDDSRWEIEFHKRKEIELLLECMLRSEVPREFQIIKYEDIR